MGNVVCKRLLLPGCVPARNWERSRSSAARAAFLCMAAAASSVGAVAQLPNPLTRRGKVSVPWSLRALGLPSWVWVSYGDPFQLLGGKWCFWKGEWGEASWHCIPWEQSSRAATKLFKT